MSHSKRYNEFTSVLDDKNYFKLVCGAGNQDSEWVERLVFIYVMAGVTGIDVAADVEVVKAAVQGVDRAEKY